MRARDRIAGELIAKARRLHEDASLDLEDGSWRGYEQHVRSYQRMLNEAYEQNASLELRAISPVPRRDRGSGRRASDAERAKLREVVKKSRVLCETLENVAKGSTPGEAEKTVDWAVSRVQRICERFHRVADFLERLYRGKQLYPVKKEHDLQCLFAALLSLEFDDVRPEERTPSHAGGSARMDFLIRPYGVVVEAKMTRKGLGDKRVGDQLILDVARYQKHPECKVLYCFVYDPSRPRRIRNPHGLAKDIESMSAKELVVKVSVCH